MLSILKEIKGMDGVCMKKWEISLLFGAAVMLVWGAVEPGALMHWWGVAFSPLCGSMNYAQLGGGDVVVRSKIWELLQLYLLN